MKPKQLMVVGSMIIFVFLLSALASTFLALPDPNEFNLPLRYHPPSFEFPFGLDANGADVFSQVIFGSQVSLLVAFTVVGLSLFIGLVLGTLAGYIGGWVDSFLMGLVNTVFAFPNILLAMAMVAALGPSLVNLIIAMCFSSWAGFAKIVRGEILHLKEKEYVSSTTALGSGPLRKVFFHIWPNLIGILSVNASFALAGTIISESGLSFLGLGAPVTTPTWGALLNNGRRYLFEAPHICLFPGLAIFFLVMGFHLFGDGLRDWLDPRENS